MKFHSANLQYKKIRITEDRKIKQVLEQNQTAKFQGDTSYVKIYLTFISCLMNRKGTRTSQAVLETLFARTPPSDQLPLYIWALRYHISVSPQTIVRNLAAGRCPTAEGEASIDGHYAGKPLISFLV